VKFKPYVVQNSCYRIFIYGMLGKHVNKYLNLKYKYFKCVLKYKYQVHISVWLSYSGAENGWLTVEGKTWIAILRRTCHIFMLTIDCAPITLKSHSLWTRKRKTDWPGTLFQHCSMSRIHHRIYSPVVDHVEVSMHACLFQTKKSIVKNI